MLTYLYYFSLLLSCCDDNIIQGGQKGSRYSYWLSENLQIIVSKWTIRLLSFIVVKYFTRDQISHVNCARDYMLLLNTFICLLKIGLR